MSVLNQTNHTRVSKITDSLALIRKSAESNNASQEELWELLSPIVSAVEQLLDPEAKPEDQPSVEPSTAAPGQTPAMWAQFLQWAQTAPIEELRPAVYHYLDRVDDALRLKP